MEDDKTKYRTREEIVALFRKFGLEKEYPSNIYATLSDFNRIDYEGNVRRF